jgi:hypothetical protein
MPWSRVGSWITTHDYLAGLAHRGHHVDATTLRPTDPYEIDGVHVNGQIEQPDVGICHLGSPPSVGHNLSRLGVPVVRMAHGHSPDNAAHLDATPTALAIFASQALADDTAWDGPQMVAHPPVFPDRYRVKPGRKITLSNLSQDKGGALLGWITEAHPELEFLGVLGWGYQYEQQGPNVEVIAPVEDMRTVYRQTRVLLMPSDRESYGRCAVEAACSGIPTIAHPSPGLMEAMGDHAIWVDRADRQGWIDKVGELQDPAVWREASINARGAVQSDPDATVDNVCEAIEELCRSSV